MSINNHQARPRKRKTGLFGCVFGFIILLGAVYGVSTFFIEGTDLLEAPWAHSISGQPTLTGTWTGEFTTSGGTQFALYLVINRARRSDGRYNTQRTLGAIMDGQAQWCDNTGRHADNVEISGSVPTFTGFNATANKVHIALMLTGQTVSGLWVDELDGKWKGDTLTLTPHLADWDGDNTVSTVDETAEPFTMTKGDQNAYQELCKKLGN
jgi:hypothetical protein